MDSAVGQREMFSQIAPIRASFLSKLYSPSLSTLHEPTQLSCPFSYQPPIKGLLFSSSLFSTVLKVVKPKRTSGEVARKKFKPRGSHSQGQLACEAITIHILHKVAQNISKHIDWIGSQVIPDVSCSYYEAIWQMELIMSILCRYNATQLSKLPHLLARFGTFNKTSEGHILKNS